MYKCLVAGCIGIKLPWEETLPLAAANGFEGVDVPLDLSKSVKQVRKALKRHKLRPGGTVLPVNFRGDDAAFRETVGELDAKAKYAAEVGCTRFYTWILPASNELTFQENYRLHAARLGRCADILAAHGCRLGLEFIGPKTSRDGAKFEFIYTLDGMLELAADVGKNAGLLLDSWHWYTSHGTVEDLGKLTDDKVVYVHVNDAPTGIAVDEQQDGVRRLPGETGVEDIAGFMGVLQRIGYTGPVTPEPFVKELADLPPAEAARIAGEAVSKIWPD